MVYRKALTTLMHIDVEKGSLLMMRRNSVIFFMLIIWGLSACQHTPEYMVQDENGIKSEIKDTMPLDQEKTSNVVSNLEMPDHIRDFFEGFDYTVNIDCDLVLPDAAVTSGQLAPLNLDLENIANFLNPEAEWICRDDGYYVLLPENERTADHIDYSISLVKTEDDITKYDIGYTEDFPAGAELIKDVNQNESMREYASLCKVYVNQLLNQMGLHAKAVKERFYAAEDHWYIDYSLQFEIDGIPVCDYFMMSSSAVHMAPIKGQISATDDQIGALSFVGNYDVVSSQQVTLLSWSDIVQCFKESIEQGNTRLKVSEIDIIKIRLEYYVFDDWSYVPVWTFYISWADDQQPVMCINACTGKTEYEW